MDCKVINEVIIQESKSLKQLLNLLDEQHELLLKNDIFSLEEIIKRIQSSNKEIAEVEVERRKITSGKPMSEILNYFDDEELDRNYRDIKKLLSEIELQKETNDMLIKQGLRFSSRILNILNPNRNMKTYNASGKITR